MSRYETDEFALFAEEFIKQVQEHIDKYSENFFYDGNIEWTFRDGNWRIVADTSATEYSDNTNNYTQEKIGG